MSSTGPFEDGAEEFYLARTPDRQSSTSPLLSDAIVIMPNDGAFRPADGRAVGDGPIKTFPLRGIKDSPPYLHDRRLLTLEDTVEFLNLVTGVKLTKQERQDLVAFLRCL